MDEVFENVLVDIGGRKSLFKMGKLGILWQLDRETGAFIRATISAIRHSSTWTRTPAK